MQPFCKLADPSTYQACSWDLSSDDAARIHWTAFFKRHLNTILSLGIAVTKRQGGDIADATSRADACRDNFYAHFDAYAQNPSAHGRVTILTLDKWRDTFLRKHGFIDAFIDLKNRENEKMLPLLPVVCRELDNLHGESQFRAIIDGIFAGNIFDMGSDATAKKFLGQSPDFFQTRNSLAKRPWLIDDYDALQDCMLNGTPYRKAVFFIDNAGSDFLLGALPMMRWLAMRGTQIVLAANERPTLNDMTIYDIRAWWPRILEVEPSLRDLPITAITTGTGEPLIDLAEISAELNEASADADLVILEGMGRGVESNLDAEFSCDAVNLAMLKDEIVAQRVNGKLFDCVCQFR
jgi:damage-control phosphatase, subfamily II, stand-alone protein